MTSDKTTARRLLDEGQGPWLGAIKRAMLLDGAFQTLLDRDIVGMTRAPSIVQTASGGADAGDGERQRLVRAGTSAAAIHDDLARDDSHAAAALLRSIYEGMAAPFPASPVREGGARLRDVMRRDVTTVTPACLLTEAVAMMCAAARDVLPVRAGGRLVGLLVGRDSVARARAAGLDPETVTVAEMMAVEPIHGWEDQDVAGALALMRARKISELTVLDRDGEIAGRFLWSPLWSSSAADPGDREDGADVGPRPWL